MAYGVVRSGARTAGAGWSNTFRALSEDGVKTITTTLNNTFILSSFDFSALPATITIPGIAVRLDALKLEASGTGDLQIGIELSWDSGSTWTTQKVSPDLIGSQEVVYRLGAPDDDWGRTWTRAELAGTNTFQVRIESLGTIASGTPEWQCEYVAVAAFYDETASETDDPQEQIDIIDQVMATSLINAQAFEKIGVLDSGSQSSTLRINRKVQQLATSGTAITDLQSDADFATTAGRPRRREGLGIMLQLAPNGPTIFVGDATLTTSTVSTFPHSYMQPGLLAVGEIQAESEFVGVDRIVSTEIRVANKTYVDQSDTSDQVPKLISTHSLGLPTLGRSLIVWGFAESGDGWKQRIMFSGEIEDIEFTESDVTVRGVQVGTGNRAIPDIIIDDDLFTYEPGSSNEDTGEQVEGNQGKPVPIGIGRFDYGAIKKPADFAAGHPMRENQESGPPAEDEKIYSQIAMFPAQFGLKHPMMPTLHVAKRWRNTELNTSGFVSFPWQNVFLYGSRRGIPHFKVRIGNDERDEFGLSQPSRDTTPNSFTPTRNYESKRGVFTWHRSIFGSFGLPCVVGHTSWWYGNLGGEFDTVLRHQVSAGFMERLAANEDTRWSDGTALDAYGIFMNNGVPDPKLEPAPVFHIRRWPGIWQAATLRFTDLTQVQSRTRIDYPGGTVLSPTFITSPNVSEPRNCMDLTNLDSVTNIPLNGTLSLQIPIDGPRLGSIRGTKFCMLWNKTTSGATAVNCAARFGPYFNYAFFRKGSTTDYSDFEHFNFAEDTTDFGANVPNMKLSGVSDRSFGQFWVSPHYPRGGSGTFSMPKEHVDPTKGGTGGYTRRRYTAEWKFTAWDIDNHGSNVFAEWPGDILITPTAGGDLDIVACWFEVLFESKLNGGVPEPVTITQADQTRSTLIVDEFGTKDVVQLGTIPGQDFEFSGGAVDPGGTSVVYVTGKGPQDDEAGSITGTANAIIENPADIASALIRHYLGDTVFKQRATGATFGSFDTAQGFLSSWRMAVVINPSQQISIRQALRQIADQSKSVIRQRLDANGELQWVMYVSQLSPLMNDAQRTYGGFTNGRIRWDNMAAGSFRCFPTPYEDLASHVVLRYGRHLPSSTWSDEMFCSPTDTNFATPGGYVAAMESTKIDSRVDRQVVITAPDVWDPATAELLCKWHCDRLRQRRIVVEFETYANAFDLEPGHVIRFNNEIGDRVAFPGGSPSTWESHEFEVIRVNVTKEIGQVSHVFVRGIETIAPAV